VCLVSGLHTHAHTHIHTHSHTHTRTNIHINTHTHIYTYTHAKHIHTQTHKHICTRVATRIHTYTYIHVQVRTHIHTRAVAHMLMCADDLKKEEIICGTSLIYIDMGWLRWVGCLKTYVSNAKEPYKRDLYSAKRHIFLSILLIVATPYVLQDAGEIHL